MQNEKEHQCDKCDIFVNAQRKLCDKKTITYSQIVDFAFPSQHGSNEIFTVQFSQGSKENCEGTLVDGQDVEVKNGMVFDVTRTDKS